MDSSDGEGSGDEGSGSARDIPVFVPQDNEDSGIFGEVVQQTVFRRRGKSRNIPDVSYTTTRTGRTSIHPMDNKESPYYLSGKK